MVSSTERKPWYRSRTYWFNILVGLLTTVLSLIELLGDPAILAVLPSGWAKWVMAGTVVGNFTMRSITAGGVSLK